MKCEFVVGQRVVCIKKGHWHTTMLGQPIPEDTRGPTCGEIVEITNMYADPENVWLVLRWHEADNSLFLASHFRPLAEPDISVFETLLADINAGKVKPVTVPA